MSHTVIPQRALTVLRAELRRLLSTRRVVARSLILGLLSVVAGLSVIFIIGGLDQEGLAAASSSINIAIEMSALIAAIAFGISALSTATADTQDGTVISSLLLVPNRARLLFARGAASTLIGAVFGVLSAATVFVVATALTGGATGEGSPALSLLSAAIAVPLTTLLGFLTGTAVRNGTSGMLLSLMGFIILPVALTAAKFVGPARLGSLLDILMQAMPGSAIVNTLSVAGIQAGTWPPALTGLLILLAWVAVVGYIAVTQFRREGRLA